MAVRKKASGKQTRAKRKVSGTAKAANASTSSNPQNQASISGNNPSIGSGFHSAEARLHKIQELAYLKAEKRNFAPGHEVEDWLEAEKEVDEASIPLPSY